MRVKIWSDNGEIDINPLWLGSKKYAELPIVREGVDLAAYEAAKQAYEVARAKLINVLAPPEPLDPEEVEAVKKDEVIA